ncbi:MAG: hypothetical protein GKR90_25725 [Pseudomonadales bacterium]|nr:hypothetical protein [Pseudomonadales bacterium]
MILITRIIVLVLLLQTNLALADDDRFELNLNYVMPIDEVRFNIASDVTGANSPDVLSELEWDDMQLHRAHIQAKYRVVSQLSVFAEAELGSFEDGDVQDSDYAGDGRTSEFSRSTATVDGKHHTGGAVGLSWQFNGKFELPLWKMRNGKRMAFASDYSVSPTLGYALSTQEIRFVDGVQVIPDLGSFPGLRSEYKTEWKGMFAGLNTRFRLLRDLEFVLDARYFPDSNFKGIGSWNLREDLQNPTSFTDTADASGYRLRYGLDWAISDNKSLNLSYYIADFETDPGSAEVHTVFGISLFTRLNEATWKSRGWSVGFNWRF